MESAFERPVNHYPPGDSLGYDPGYDEDKAVQLEEHLRRVIGPSPVISFALELPGRRPVTFGRDLAQFTVSVRTTAGVAALASFDELTIAEAYMDGDIDFVGKMSDVLYLRELCNHTNMLITVWRKLQPLLVGRRRSNEQWVQNHYDSDNIQLYYLDRDYNTYTPGVFEREDETLEVASERKHRLAFAGLGLKAGDRILEVGFGWGSFLRYAARRGVHVTGITLSKHQLAYVTERFIDGEGLDVELIYRDFFSYEPTERFDGIVMIGVIEELADFAGVMERISRWVKPGKKAYIDFMAATEDFRFPGFVSKYIYQGGTCRVYLPKFVDAVTQSPFELDAIYNDRRNYYLTARHWYERLEANADEIRAAYGERRYRMFRMYLAGAAHMLDHPSHLTTAYRVFLSLPEDHLAVHGKSGLAAWFTADHRTVRSRISHAVDGIRRTLPYGRHP